MQVVSWLQAARAQDIVLLTRTESSPGSGSDGMTRWMVVATAASDRHAAACAGAVRYQVREAIVATTRSPRVCVCVCVCVCARARWAEAQPRLGRLHAYGTVYVVDWICAHGCLCVCVCVCVCHRPNVCWTSSTLTHFQILPTTVI